jgi:uncharacterized protein (DUF1330 family)
VQQALGEDYFFAKLAEFDQHNEKVISLYSHHADELLKKLGPNYLALVEDFRALAPIMYWRKA